jgi:hypothetical protein
MTAHGGEPKRRDGVGRYPKLMNKQDLIAAVQRFRYVEVWSGACGAWVPVHRTRFLSLLRDDTRDYLVYRVDQVGSILRIG